MTEPVLLPETTALVKIPTAVRVGATRTKNVSVKPTVARASILAAPIISAARTSVTVMENVHALPRVRVVTWVEDTVAMV